MKSGKLGNSDLNLTRIGYGAWAIGGGDWSHGWGPQDDNDSIAAIHKALSLGINWIDTAAIYGLGHSEELVAKSLKTTSHKSYIFTKCSMRWDDKRELSHRLVEIRSEVEERLRRLEVEAIDLYQIHWLNPDGVYSHEGMLAGFGWLVSDGALYGTLWNIAVHPQFQKLGIGTAIVWKGRVGPELQGQFKVQACFVGKLVGVIVQMLSHGHHILASTSGRSNFTTEP
jgi:aryl-alcohol dehydrogenase-like predicted oxidoreductase